MLDFDLRFMVKKKQGAVAIETLGGPKIGFKAGRVDSMDPKDVTPDGRLPDADKGNPMKTAAHLREIFGRMGFNDQEIVALAGAHALGRCYIVCVCVCVCVCMCVCVCVLVA